MSVGCWQHNYFLIFFFPSFLMGLVWTNGFQNVWSKWIKKLNVQEWSNNNDNKENHTVHVWCPEYLIIKKEKKKNMQCVCGGPAGKREKRDMMHSVFSRNPKQKKGKKTAILEAPLVRLNDC